MTNTPTRRQLLKATAASSAAGTVLSTAASAASSTTVRTIEAGIYYDLDVGDNFVQMHLDSRPAYTVDAKRNDLVYPERVPASMTAAVSQAGALFAENPVRSGSAAEVGPTNRLVRTLPTKLSTRKRPMEGVKLASKRRLPEASIKRTGTAPRLVVPSETTIDLSPGTDREVRLSPQTVEVQTVRVTDEVVPVEGVPEHRWGPKREYDSVEVEATPVVSVTDRGELALRRHKLP